MPDNAWQFQSLPTRGYELINTAYTIAYISLELYAFPGRNSADGSQMHLIVGTACERGRSILHALRFSSVQNNCGNRLGPHRHVLAQLLYLTVDHVKKSLNPGPSLLIQSG